METLATEAGALAVQGLAGTPVAGLFGMILLPAWCADSLRRDSARSGRSVASITRWALVWPLVLVAALAVLTAAFGALAAASGAAGWLAPVLVLWLLGPAAVGAIIAMRARDLGGVGVGAIGLVAGGLVLGLVAWLVDTIVWLLGLGSVADPIAALVYLPLAGLLIPTLTAAQLGMGVLAVSLLSSLWRQVRGHSQAEVGLIVAGPGPADRQASEAPRATGAALSAATPQTPLALEAEHALAAVRTRDRPTPTSRIEPSAVWAARSFGALLGVLVLWFVATSGTDSGEATFGLGLLALIAGLVVASLFRGTTLRILALVREASLGLAAGVVLFIALTFALAFLQAA